MARHLAREAGISFVAAVAVTARLAIQPEFAGREIVVGCPRNWLAYFALQISMDLQG